MSRTKIDESFRQYLLSSYPVDKSMLDHLIDDLAEYFRKVPEDFIRHRHNELQLQGMKNEEIYRAIQEEMKSRLFAGPKMSLRQIRRAIYG